MQTILTSKGQVTIPRDVCQLFGLRQGNLWVQQCQVDPLWHKVFEVTIQRDHA